MKRMEKSWSWSEVDVERNEKLYKGEKEKEEKTRSGGRKMLNVKCCSCLFCGYNSCHPIDSEWMRENVSKKRRKISVVKLWIWDDKKVEKEKDRV